MIKPRALEIRTTNISKMESCDNVEWAFGAFLRIVVHSNIMSSFQDPYLLCLMSMPMIYISIYLSTGK